MNEFRQALDAHADGQLELSGVERELNLGLTRQPHLAAAHGALVEALYRSGRIKGETYLALSQAVRAFQQSQPRVNVQVAPVSPAPTAGAEDKTQFRAPGRASQPTGTPAAPAAVDPDKTQFRAPRVAPAANASPAAPGTVSPGPASQSAAAAASTGMGSHGGPSAPPFAATPAGGLTVARVATDSRLPTGSRPTNSSWTDLGRSVADGPPLAAGSIVKDRFVLEEELGRGGMGIVFKARDLRKEEAQDRNPWVALKLLNDEFRRHPESLKALQRESRKAQHLAHANVVTVYDFDRDGGNVFMVMELLEGESLDTLIRDNEGSGLGAEKALRITRDLCRAMAYAHEQGVVHSDFKPANAFLTKEGVVKVFDFGIARAAKRADNVSGSTTLFDPGTLGALTPTYASCEMIEGLEPDSRDDVYAMACVVYELLTGKHPFNRSSAVEARDKRMTAKRPRGIKRYQWRAIQHGLQFGRENRTASAQQFLSELMPRKRRPTVHIGLAAVVVVGLVVVGLLVPGYLAKRREKALIDALTIVDTTRLDALVQELRSLAPEQRAAILLNEGARAGLIKTFEGRINAATDASRPVTDYPAARVLLGELQAFLPDSLAVKDLEDRLGARENDEIKRLSDRFDDYLNRGLLIEAQGTQNVGTVLASIRRIDAQNRLLNDPRLPGAFAQQTSKALQTGNATLAQALVNAGLSFDSKDTTLTDLRDQVQRAADTQQLLARRQSLESSLASLTADQAAFADIEAKRAELEQLRSIAPDSAVLASVQQLAQRGVSAQVSQLMGSDQHAQAIELISRYTDLLPPAFVDQQRQKLASARGAFEAQQAVVAQTKQRIDTLLANQKADSQWGSQFDHELRQLAAFVPAGDPYVAQIKARAAGGYLDQARTLRASQRLTEAARMVDAAKAYAPRSADLAAEQKLLADARTTQESSAQQRNRLAQLDALKTKLLVQARANEVNEALASFTELRSNLDANDGYIVVQAPEAIGAAYLRLASSAAKDGRFANAVSLTSRAKEIAPGLDGVTPAGDRYTRYQALEQLLKTGAVIDATSTRSELERLGRADASEAASVSDRLLRGFVARIRSTGDATVARRLTALAQEIFGDRAAKALNQAALDRAPAAAPTSTPQQSQTQPSASTDPAPSAASQPASAAAGERKLASATPSTQVNSLSPAQALAPRVPSEIPCTERLAGYGKRRQAICYDTYDGGGRGPDLVVIPAGGSNAKSFAFGRTEVSNADFAAYCTRTGKCKAPAEQAEYPVTGVSVEEARAYAAWLSQVTGAPYRLPTDGEWTYAVTAQGGKTDVSSVNCLVEIGGKKVRGVALEPVQSGSSNGWGLYNALGNAQEWVVSGSTVLVQGGAFSDSMSSCTLESKRTHGDAGDAVTGIRLVRELQ